MKQKMIVPLLLCAVFLFAFVSYTASIKAERKAAIAFFSSVLQQHEARERVMIQGGSYDVINGTVTNNGEPVSDTRTQFDALRTAFALETARRSPFLDLEGTNPQKLRIATARLANIAILLAAQQKTPHDKNVVLRSLYPIGFLYSLADLESARKDFIENGSDASRERYEDALAISIGKARSEIRDFKDAFDTLALRDYSVVGGVVTASSSDSVLKEIMLGFDTISDAARKRTLCTSGKVYACNIRDIDVPTPAPEAVPSNASDIPPLVLENMSIMSAGGDGAVEKGTVVALERSVCVGNDFSPAFFSLQSLEDNSSYPVLEYVGDIFFMPVDGTSVSGIFSNLKVSYLMYTPTTYYECPNSALDLGRAIAVEKASDALFGLDKGYTRSETAVKSELHARLSVRNTDKFNTLLPFYLMFKDNSAGLDDIVNEIAIFGKRDLTAQDSGIVTSFDPEFLFAVRSGFYALFLTHNPSAGTRDVRPFDEGVENPIYNRLVTWSSLRQNVSQKQIEKFISTYFVYHTKPGELTNDENEASK